MTHVCGSHLLGFRLQRAVLTFLQQILDSIAQVWIEWSDFFAFQMLDEYLDHYVLVEHGC